MSEDEDADGQGGDNGKVLLVYRVFCAIVYILLYEHLEKQVHVDANGDRDVYFMS